MPEEQEQGVIAESPTAEQMQDVIEESSPSQEQSFSEEIIDNPAQGEEPLEIDTSSLQAVDERGVPLKNVESEWKRKFEQFVEKQPDLISEAVKAALSSTQSQQQEVTEDQLLSVLHDDTGQFTSANKVWAQQELRKREEARLSNMINETLQTKKRQDEEARIRQQSEAMLVQQFPQMFAKDASGKISGWNTDNQMTKALAQYMQDPTFANQPDGILKAAKLAYADTMLSSKGKETSSTQRLQAENAQLKRATMPGAGKQASTNNVAIQEAYQRFMTKGDMASATEYYKLKAQAAAKG